MKDRFLFRGKSINTNDWLIGYYSNAGSIESDTNKIIPTYASAFYGLDVYANTIGQCTGLKDNTGNLIFEGDVLTSEELETHRECPDDLPYAVIKWCNIKCCWYADIITSCNVIPAAFIPDHGIIGNIHDNPYLLKGGAG